MGRGWLIGCVVSMLLGGAAAVARPIPGTQDHGFAPDTFETLAADGRPVDPVIEEPIRPLFPADDSAASSSAFVRQQSCGAVSPVLFALMFVSLGFMGGRGQRVQRL